MSILSNERLIEAYLKAKKLKLPKDFIDLIDQELDKRGLQCLTKIKDSSRVTSL